MSRGLLLPARSENEYFVIGAGFNESGKGPQDGGARERDQDWPNVWWYTREQRDVMIGPLSSNRTTRQAHISKMVLHFICRCPWRGGAAEMPC